MLNLKFFFILFLVALCNGQQNITVDDNDSSIVYAPSDSWVTVSDSMDIGGSHKVTIDTVATATFTFTGLNSSLYLFLDKHQNLDIVLSGDAIYYSSGMWPFTVNTLISLDGGSATLVDLTDHSSELIDGAETVASSVVWSQTGLDDTIKHTLVISVSPGQEYAVVDSLTYVLHAPRSPCVVSSFLQVYSYKEQTTAQHHPIRVDEYSRHLHLKQQQRRTNTNILL